MKKKASELTLSEFPAINKLLSKVVTDIGSFAESQVSHIHELVKIGLALSAEKRLDRLLEMIVSEARRFTNADGGTLYIKDDDGARLNFAIVQNDTLKVQMGGSGEKITWPPVPLRDGEGKENHRNVSAHCALIGEAINIPDVYDAEGFDFQGTKNFDTTTGYRSKSMLVIPMRDHEDAVIGVLQLLNAKNRDTGQVMAFPAHEIEIITSLASQAAIALTNIQLIKGLENLLNSFIKSIATAIDEKSPYTAGHIQRVAEITDLIVGAINSNDTGKFAKVTFSRDEVKELRMAAWMHDVGKITTPEYVVDKSTKLETIFDRITVIRCRIEILKRDAEIERLKRCMAQGGLTSQEEPAGSDEKIREIEEHLAFLETVNIGGEFLRDESLEKINALSKLRLTLGATEIPLLDENEVENLSIRKGTLTGKEREVINNHVTITQKMLGNMPFPKKLRHVPLYAGMHHEHLDGSGYPRGLYADDIPLQARILAVADVFEALTASDRPYKKGKLMSESIKILAFMVKDNHLDEDVCDLIIESGVASAYARKNLAPRQQDDFEWKGKKYSVQKG